MTVNELNNAHASATRARLEASLTEPGAARTPSRPPLLLVVVAALALAALAVAPVAAQTPIRGFADLHAHWFSNFVPGGFHHYGDLAGVYCGYDWPQPGATLAQQADCALNGRYDPQFGDLPKFGETTDQKAFYEWIKRAWDYGMRLTVVHSVYSNLACTHPISGTHRWVDGRKCNAEVAVRDQIQDVKNFVTWVQQNDPDDWVDIAYSPAQARQIMQAGKLAIVLGVEVDDLMNCVKNSCTTADVTRKLQRLHALGVRHVFPVHGIDSGFGGAGFFQELYGFQQWIYPGHSNWFGLRECAANSSASFKLWGTEGFGVTSIGTGISGLHFGGFLKGYYPLTIFDSEWYWTSHCNTLGLTSLGDHLVETAMRLGMLIDVDHMSERSFDDTHAKATDLSFQSSLGRSGPYPLVASHISVREMRPDRGKDFRHFHTHERNKQLGGEFHKTVAQLNKIAATGGIVAPILTQKEARDYTGTHTHVDNDCFDATSTWAQVFLRAVDIMGGKNVALGTDVNGQAPFPGPRFGAKACGDGEVDGARVTRQKGIQTRKKNRLVYGQTYSVLGKPLTQAATGPRTFDVNTDGVAHIGLVPDMIADMENIGVATADLDVLMSSAEDYVDVWQAAQPSFDFRPFESNRIYHGISQSAPPAFAGSKNCPAAGGSLGQDARWWEFEIDAADVAGFDPASTMTMTDYPNVEACILDGTLATGIRVAVPIAPKAPWMLAAYDSDEWEVTVFDAATSNVTVRPVRILVPEASVSVALLGGATVESGDCPLFSAEEEPGSEREILHDAINRATGVKMRQEMQAQVSAHTGDFTPLSYAWTAESPAGPLGTGDTVPVEFCPCGSRWVGLVVEEDAGIETVEVGFLMDAAELSLTVAAQHIDRFGAVILDPTHSKESAATIELSVTPFRSHGPTPACSWPELRWSDPTSMAGAAAETDVPAGRLAVHGNGCTATLTVWDPATDPGSEPWPKAIRGVVKMEDGAQCGKKLFEIDTLPLNVETAHDFSVAPLKPLKVKIGNAGAGSRTVKLAVRNTIDDSTGEAGGEGSLATLETTNLDCPADVTIGEPTFVGGDVGEPSQALLAPGDSAKARIAVDVVRESFGTAGRRAPLRCQFEVRAVGVDDSDATTDNAALVTVDLFDRSADDTIDGPEVVVRAMKNVRARTGSSSDRPGRAKLKAIVENLGTAPAEVEWELVSADCAENSLPAETAGSLSLEPGARERLRFDLSISPEDYPAATPDRAERCHVALVATADEDLDETNNAAQTVVEIFGRQ